VSRHVNHRVNPRVNLLSFRVLRLCFHHDYCLLGLLVLL
jgi:hypothetical protein